MPSEREEPEDDREPRTVGETLGDDAPRVGPRRLGRVRRQRVDQVGAEEPADEQQQDSRDQEADRERPELDAPPAAREPDGQRGEQRCATSQSQFARAWRMRAPVCAVSSWSELTIAIWPVDSGSCSRDPPDDRHLLAEVDDDRPEVEHHLPAGRRDELALVVEELDELPLRRGRHAHPCLLQAGPLEEPVRGLLRALPGDPREHRSERLLRLRQALGERLLDVDVRVQLLDGRRRHLRADLVGRISSVAIVSNPSSSRTVRSR